jgi:hypothetical protein
MSLFNEVETECDVNVSDDTGETVRVKEHTRKKKPTNDEKLGDIPVEDVVIELPKEDQVCPLLTSCDF